MKIPLILLLCMLSSALLVANPARLTVGAAKKGAESVAGRIVRKSSEQTGKIAAERGIHSGIRAVTHETDLVRRIGEQVTPVRIVTTGAAAGAVVLADGYGDALEISAEKEPESFSSATTGVMRLIVWLTAITLCVILSPFIVRGVISTLKTIKKGRSP